MTQLGVWKTRVENLDRGRRYSTETIWFHEGFGHILTCRKGFVSEQSNGVRKQQETPKSLAIRPINPNLPCL